MKENSSQNKRQQQAKLIRVFRNLHRKAGALLFAVFFVVAITGLLLGWKKNSNGLIQAKSVTGTSTDLKEWLSIDSLHRNACRYLHDSVGAGLSLDLDRIDIRQDKGIVKFVFAANYVGLNLDGATGNLLQIEQRRSDFIENLHDGSILDKLFGTRHEQFKLIFTSITGLALLLFTVTGFWLWYGPKRMRKGVRQDKSGKKVNNDGKSLE